MPAEAARPAQVRREVDRPATSRSKAKIRLRASAQCSSRTPAHRQPYCLLQRGWQVSNMCALTICSCDRTASLEVISHRKLLCPCHVTSLELTAER